MTIAATVVGLPLYSPPWLCHEKGDFCRQYDFARRSLSSVVDTFQIDDLLGRLHLNINLHFTLLAPHSVTLVIQYALVFCSSSGYLQLAHFGRGHPNYGGHRCRCPD